ncbi:aconitase [Rhizobium mongolense subsp. loessense]|uniref:Aconitate hydratase A n=1 Tax=Rhizobium mongolense subsp. loessense TaxID=158890 RepID=A0A1G4R290_9HYPH|nr:aconitase [Rhizobium mongolense subsp. loessense]
MSWFELPIAGNNYRAIDLRSDFGADLDRLPWLMRIMLENCIRNSEGDERNKLVEHFRSWLIGGTSQQEIPFYPGRVLMHDTTCVPALVDIAAMRDVVAENGGDPTNLVPALRVDVSVDHSVGVDRYGTKDAMAFNMHREMERNAERYRLMKWATTALPGIHVHPPGTGIMHTMNLEQLATVISVDERDGVSIARPDTLIGTDSHTPMINGIGVVAWGVGGLEAESVIFGMPVTLRLPDVIGVRCVGALKPGVLSTDLALAVTHLLRRRGISGEFVEFFGPGVSQLSAGDRAVVANMAPEYGASSGYFPIDSMTIRYLATTGRTPEHCMIVEEVTKAQGLWFDSQAQPKYSDVLELDLSTLTPVASGPQRPQDMLPIGQVANVLRATATEPARGTATTIPPYPIAIAAITSCTNTSDPKLLITAGLLARRARSMGLRPPHWVKTSLAPGSPAAERFLARAGLLEDLEAVGFGIVGYGCTTCIGNSGPLHPDMQDAVESGSVATAVLSGNRNFPGRVHPSLKYGFLMSPPMVIAHALVGTMDRDVGSAVLATRMSGQEIRLADLWPTAEEIDALTAASLEIEDFGASFAHAEQNASWSNLAASSADRFPWDPASTYITRPPFASIDQPNRLGTYTAHPLLVLGDDVTTDHISPAGQISSSSYAGQHLVAAGDPKGDLNVYAARRGNWKTMVRGLFDNRTASNLLVGTESARQTIHAPSGTVGPIWEIAERYGNEGIDTVIVAGERYGAGSSRDWAAKGVALLGVRAILAQSFERIHRSNLIGMGVLPILMPAQFHPEALTLRPGDLVIVKAEAISPRCPVEVEVARANGTSTLFNGRAAVETELDVVLLNAGGMIPHILAQR